MSNDWMPSPGPNVIAHLRADDSLKEPGIALYVEVPVNVLPHASNWDGIVADVRLWLRENAQDFKVKREVLDCPSAHHPSGKIAFRVRRQPLDRTHEGFVIVQRYGDICVDQTVTRALQRKLPKLIQTPVDVRLLMLERDQGFVYPEAIVQEVDKLRSRIVELASVNEIWIADTASFDERKEYVDFQRFSNGRMVESFTFYRGELESISKNGMPVPRDWWPS